MKSIKRILLGIVSLIVVCFVFIKYVYVPFVIPGENASVENSQNTGIVYESESSVEEDKETFDDSDKEQIISTPLNIELSGRYLESYNEATKNLTESESDRNKRLVAMIGLQILQANVIKYEYEYHFYSLEYSNSGGVQAAEFYSLKDCIDRINTKKTVYTDCFGFVRLVHSIAAYSINSDNPKSVNGLCELYGYRGSYTGSAISSLNKLDCSTLIYDRLTGTGSSENRHVAIYLYSNGNKVVYMDQAGIFEGTYNDSSYIYYPKLNPYKFNTFKSYC